MAAPRIYLALKERRPFPQNEDNPFLVLKDYEGQLAKMVFGREDLPDSDMRKWRFPANSTLKSPGDPAPEGWAHCLIDGEWLLTEDYRGQELYRKADGTPIMECKSLGPLPNLLTADPPPFENSKWKNGDWVEDVETKRKALAVDQSDFMVALYQSQVFPRADVVAWASGTLPASIEAVIMKRALPSRPIWRIKLLTFGLIFRKSPLVSLIAEAANVTDDAVIDSWFGG